MATLQLGHARDDDEWRYALKWCKLNNDNDDNDDDDIRSTCNAVKLLSEFGQLHRDGSQLWWLRIIGEKINGRREQQNDLIAGQSSNIDNN